MEGILKKVELKEYEIKQGKMKGNKFKKFEFTCDVVVDDKGNIKTMKGSYSEDFARKYFEYCNVKTKDLIGKKVQCITAKKKYENDKGEEKTVNFIRFLNVLDNEGNPIIMPKDTQQEMDF